MNRFAAIFAMIVVVLGVSVATSFSTAISLAFATAMVGGSMLVHEYAFDGTAGGATTWFSRAREFLASVIRFTIRFSIAAMAIAWTVVSLQWYIGS